MFMLTAEMKTVYISISFWISYLYQQVHYFNCGFLFLVVVFVNGNYLPILVDVSLHSNIF